MIDRYDHFYQSAVQKFVKFSFAAYRAWKSSTAYLPRGSIPKNWGVLSWIFHLEVNAHQSFSIQNKPGTQNSITGIR
jgi:hypothetical protein